MPLNPANIVQGPAIITFDGYAFYTKGDIAVRVNRNTFNVETSMHGKIDERMASQIVEISFQPVGEMETIAKYFPFGVASIGASIFGASDKTVEIWTLAGQKITWARGAISKMPTLRLKARDTLFGEMTITCIGKSNTEWTTTGAWKAITTTAFADTSFDETKIKTARYSAAYGSSPYDAMLSQDGFEIDIGMETENIDVDAHGIQDIYLKSLVATARFTPIGLTEAQIDTLLKLQDTGALLPGESLAKADTDLVISASGVFSATLHKAGPKNTGINYGIGKNRLGQLEWMAKRTWTTGAANALYTFTIS